MSAADERSRSNRSDSTDRYVAALRSAVGKARRVLCIGTPVSLAIGAEVVPIDTTADSAELETSAAPFDVVVCNLLAPGALARWLPVAKKLLAPAGRLVVGCAHEGSAAHALSTLTNAGPVSVGGGTSLPMLIATLAASGYAVESGRAIAVGETAGEPDSAAAFDPEKLLAIASAPSIDYYVVAGRGADAGEAAARARRQLQPGRDEPVTAVGAAEALAQTALLRREQQLAVLEGSLGWRLLSHYGPYKRRFVVPAWRRVQAASRRWLRLTATPVPTPYEEWTRFADRVHQAGSTARADTDAALVTVTVVMTVDHEPLADVQRAVAALVAQSHQRWQLLIAAVGDVGSATVRGLQASDARIAIDSRPSTTAAEAANVALARADGGLVAFFTALVALAPDALATAIRAMADARGDVLYGDDDAVDEAGRRHSPRLKPGWSPDLLLSTFYWSGVVLYRRELLASLGPLSSEYEGAHHYDLALRATEQDTRIVHVPRLLAHMSAAAGDSTTRGTPEGGRRALAAALARRGIAGTVHWHEAGSVYRVQRAIARHGKVTIIIPTRDGLAMLQRCLRAVEAADHPSVAVVIVDNGSVEPATLAFLKATRHTVIRAPGPFNFSRLNNLAVAETTGDHLVFLNDDTEARSPGWLQALEEHAERPEVGAVGAKLLYPDGRIQHAGIALGIGGLAGHPHRFQRDAPEAIRNVSAVTAACLMMRREVFEAVGGFDERLPVNSNDVDLCLRVRARGHLIVYTPYAVLTHYESASRGARATPDDAWLMTRRWRSALADDPYYSPNADRREETGDIDLAKPDGMVCLYAGSERRRAPLSVPRGGSVGQRFFATAGHLCAVVVRLADGAVAAGALRLRLRSDPESVTDVRVVAGAVAGRTPDERWFCFEPIEDSKDRFWYFVVENHGERDVAVMRTPIVSDVMGPCHEGDRPSHGTLLFELYAQAPWRCATTPS